MSKVQPRQVKHPLVGVLVSFSILVGLAIPAIWELVPASYTWLAGKQAQGIAYQVKDCHQTDDNGDELYEVTFLYKDAQGQLQESTSGTDCRSDFTNGQSVSAWYLPNEPGGVLFNDGLQIVYFVFMLLALAGMLVCLGFLLYCIWALIKACRQGKTFTRLLLAVLGCLVIAAPAMALLHFFPPPANQLGTGPTRNFHLGQAVTAENHWAVTIQGGHVGLIRAPHDGSVCLELTITLRNSTHQTLSFQKDQFTLYDAQIKPRGAACETDTPALGNATLAPGATIQGINSYEVPASMRQFYLAFRPNPQGEDNVGRYIWNFEVT